MGASGWDGDGRGECEGGRGADLIRCDAVWGFGLGSRSSVGDCGCCCTGVGREA